MSGGGPARNWPQIGRAFRSTFRPPPFILEELRDAAVQAIVTCLDARELQYARTDDGVFVTSFVADGDPCRC